MNHSEELERGEVKSRMAEPCVLNEEVPMLTVMSAGSSIRDFSNMLLSE